ncbi:DsbA family protein [Streptomyces sp. NBC_01190]|uniref:DsbA family oxidoreductase n=1 Tax=Streptomyces sp. NBC_01190 TaxID=2903767 RepID=UPI00386933F1|nr:DsbA family protein [Streptomyces sp. NBC_01190]
MSIGDFSPAGAEATAPVLHWYDFVCPFCYVGQDRSRILTKRGFTVLSIPLPIHPEIPQEGVEAGPRQGPMYEFLQNEARAAGLPLHWPARLPNTILALTVAEWVRRHEPGAFPALYAELFEAHFVRGEDIGALAVVQQHAAASGVDIPALTVAMTEPGPAQDVEQSSGLAEHFGIAGTPAWLVGSLAISGLRPRSEFEEFRSA